MRGVRTRAADYVATHAVGIVDTATITSDAVEQYQLRADHQPAIAFCITVAHAEHVAGAFRDAGYRAACVHGATPIVERDALVAGLSDGRLEVLTSCDLISEGLDVPAVGCVILLRPTKSLTLHRQQIGHGMRTAPGKTALIVLDHVGNVITHGLPETDAAWSLAGVEQRQGNAPVWRCDGCGAANPNAVGMCQACGATRPFAIGGRRHEIATAAGDLAEITWEWLHGISRLPYRAIVNSRFTEAELRVYALAHGYRRGWVYHRLCEQRRAI